MYNIPLVGLCGQSGSGKTTILDRLHGRIVAGKLIAVAPNIIKSICADPSQLILTPDFVISQYSHSPDTIQDVYKEYIHSQKNLQYMYSKKIDSQLYTLREQNHGTRRVLLSDRTFIDFYLYTKGALNYFERVIGIKPDEDCYKLLNCMMTNTNNLMRIFYSSVITIFPHDVDISSECSGSRLSGIQHEFTGDNWYGSIHDIDYEPIVNSMRPDVDGRCAEVISVIERI